jgi:hypothetical protein
MHVTLSNSLLASIDTQDPADFIKLLAEAYLEAIDNHFDPHTMSRLNAWQHSLLAYYLFKEEVLQGGFVQLIQNGYGPYIFQNPFARSMKLMGAVPFASIIYNARKIYFEHQQELERETTEEEFYALYEQFEAFDNLEDEYYEMEDEINRTLASYVKAHPDEFAEWTD